MFLHSLYKKLQKYGIREKAGSSTFSIGSEDLKINVSVERCVRERLKLVWVQVIVDGVGRVIPGSLVDEEA